MLFLSSSNRASVVRDENLLHVQTNRPALRSDVARDKLANHLASPRRVTWRSCDH